MFFRPILELPESTAIANGPSLTTNNRYTYPIINDKEKNSLHVYKIFTSYYQRPNAGEIDKYFKALTWSKSDTAWQFKVNIATNVQKDEPFVLLIKYNCRVKKGEMEQQWPVLTQTDRFYRCAGNLFYLGFGPGYRISLCLVPFQPNAHPLSPVWAWSVITPLLHTASLDTSVIDQDAESGVVPIYPIKGKIFLFYPAQWWRSYHRLLPG